MSEQRTDKQKKIEEKIKELSPQMSISEKEILKQRINRTVKSGKRRKVQLVISLSTAAAILIGILIYNIAPNNKPIEIKEFALNTKIQIDHNTTDTKLILNDEESIDIKSKEAVIKYSSDGSDIKIDSLANVEQEVIKEKPVFNTIVVPYGKRSQVLLTDGTNVWLNSGSKLTYPAVFANLKREVFLEGEAIFEVTHNEERPFYVITSKLQIKVLGTIFNVSAYADDEVSSAVLEKGKIELNYENPKIFQKSSLVMNPGMLVSYNSTKKTIQSKNVDPKYYTAWKNGMLVFERERLGDIVKKISRYYDVEIKIENEKLINESYSGYLDLKSSAIQVLEIINQTSRFSLTEKDETIIIN